MERVACMPGGNQPQTYIGSLWFMENIMFPIIVVLAAAAIFFFVWRRFRLWFNPGKPVVTVAARVVSLQNTLSSDVLGETVQERKTRANFYATFTWEDGIQQEFEITRSLYETLRKGDKGQLTIKGLRLIRFVKD
jgi:hypothetical protein